MKEELALFRQWMAANQLVKVVIVKRKVGPSTFVGRMILYEEDRGALLFYDDDRKEVVHLLMNEIDSIEQVGEA